MYKINKSQLRVMLLVPALCVVYGCNQLDLSSTDLTQTGTSQTSIPASSVKLTIANHNTSAVIFNDTTGNTTFNLTAGTSYNVSVSAANLPAGATVEVQATNSSVPNAAVQTIQITSGTNVFLPATAGDYTFKIVVLASTGASYLTKPYTASVACSNPTFTANSLSGAGISVNGSDNVYSYNAAGVIGGANGQAPYLCQWDFTGVGIVDNGFTDCSTTVANVYSPYVSTRNVGVIVKDACNTSYHVTKSVNFPAAVPSAPGNNFITGTVSNATGTAATDSRINGVTFSSINTGVYRPVVTGYWGSTFRIQSQTNYGTQSSSAFGMYVDISGLAGTFNLSSNVNGTITGGHVADVIYNTDQAGDQNPAVSLTSNTCTSTVNARVLNPVGTPCTTGTNPDANTATVEVYGSYTCTNATDAGGSITLTGTFDGSIDLADSCVGGGGGGGGGIQPPAF